ncbi:hypothetical protein ON010_g11553 [Phytophthora cinnamomi]|nr:hypothetical protein ON010_g11553 [Phytophthora cinnamomi]
MSDLLNDANTDDRGSVLVGENGYLDASESATPLETDEYADGEQVSRNIDGGTWLWRSRGARFPCPDRRPPSRATACLPCAAFLFVDVFGLQQDRFVEEQRRTPWILAMIAYLENGAVALEPQLRTRTLLMAPNYVVRNGVPMRRVHLKARDGPASSIEVPVTPLQFMSTMLHHCHTDVLAAHVGITKTLNKVRKHAFWHGRKRDVAKYIRECTTCGSGKGHRPWRNGLMQRMPIQELSGPFSLLVVDACVEACAISRLDSVTFVETMVNEAISRHGLPERLLSDQESIFSSELARAFYDTLGIRKLFGAAYHPHTQGLVERFNDTLLGMLRLFVNETQIDWDLYLPRVSFAYRTSCHESLKDSPFFSLYGQDPVLSLDLAFLNTKNNWKRNEVAAFRRRLFLSLRDTRRKVERQLLKAHDRHAVRLEDQKEAIFEVGDPVWVYQYFRARRRRKKKDKKLVFSWHGAYRVVGTVGENAYRVPIPTHPNRVITINVNRLKRFKGRWSRPYPSDTPSGVIPSRALMMMALSLKKTFPRRVLWNA